MSHTPGPWHVDEYGEGDFRWSVYASPAKEGGFGNLVVGDLGEANARLIAAAPDLLAALKAHVEYECSNASGLKCDPTPEQADAYFAMMKRSLEALHKAESSLDPEKEAS